MINNIIKNEFSIFWIVIIFIISFNYISFNFFIKSFISLENKENIKSLTALTAHIDSKFQTIKISANDYSQWDQTYNFIEDHNENFIYENFRDTTTTIENINLNFMIFINSKNEKVFEQITANLKIKDPNDFIKFTSSLLEENQYSTIMKYENNYYYLVKSKITKSDLSGEFRGYVYAGKLLTMEGFNNDYKSLIKIIDKKDNKSDMTLYNKFIKEILVHFNYKNDILSNIITLKNDGKVLVTFELDNVREIYKEGEKQIILFNTIVSTFILIIFFVFYLYLHQHKKLNAQLEDKVKEEIKKQKAQEEILIKQARLAEMGEMINNIAHQWRQPLNSLGLVIQNINFSYQMGELDQESLDRSINKSKKIVSAMSNTIDTFRNFFEPHKDKKLFSIEQSINNTLEIMNSTLSYYDIEITKEIAEDIRIFDFENEFSQVILNIITNAKDALISNEIKNKKIKINASKTENLVLISITDNAQGIDKEIMDKIFEPYFTTKEKGKGTGIGLYMSKIIIEKNMNGKLEVENIQDGVTFKIILPLR